MIGSVHSLVDDRASGHVTWQVQMAVAAYLTGSTGSTLCAFTLLHSRTVHVHAFQSNLASDTYRSSRLLWAAWTTGA